MTTEGHENVGFADEINLRVQSDVQVTYAAARLPRRLLDGTSATLVFQPY